MTTGPLPDGAFVIERADLTKVVGKSRTLVLWMQNPKKVPRNSADEYSCPEHTTGSYFSGPTRVSLMDGEKDVLLNTIAVRDGRDEDSFDVPYLIKQFYYLVPQLDASGEGTPKILSFGDYNGDGFAAEFVLYDSTEGACGDVDTTLIGYDPKTDKVLQYPVESVNDQGQNTVAKWAGRGFAEKPNGTGRVDFTWSPGHGSDDTTHEIFSFDSARNVFTKKTTTVITN
jgi:hypothetical protein